MSISEQPRRLESTRRRAGSCAMSRPSPSAGSHVQGSTPPPSRVGAPGTCAFGNPLAHLPLGGGRDMATVRRIGAAVVAASALSMALSGCGSMFARDLVHKHDSRLVPMGGTALDAVILTAPLNPIFWPDIAKAPASLLLWPIALGDFPLSAAFDTVTLPVALAETLASLLETPPAAPPPSPKPAPRPTVQHDDPPVGVNWLSAP